MPDESNGISVGWNGKQIAAKGLGVYAVLAVLAIIASILYTGSETKRSIAQIGAGMTAEHRSLRLAQDRTSCIVSLTVEDRAVFRLRYQPGSFRQWCPWMEE